MARCLVCDREDWVNVDEYRLKPMGMSACKNCGFVSYPEKIEGKEDLLEFYREDYRPAPTVKNFYTGERKLHYHAAFLADIINDWGKRKYVPDVLEVGSAFGMVLDFFKRHIECNIYGTELTESFRRNAFHEYNVELIEDFDDTKRYDLIMSYKVDEHIIDADKELRRRVECLKDGGYIYVSVPCWFGKMHNFGVGGWDIEYYYHPNHINVWTKDQFEYVLKKVGLKVIKQDHEMYDDTYLCVRDDSLMKTEMPKFDFNETISNLKKIKIASDMASEKKFAEAVEVWPRFPYAWAGFFEMNRAKLATQGFDYVMEQAINPAVAACGENDFDILNFKADMLMRFDRFKEALDVWDHALQVRPNSPGCLTNAALCYRALANNAADENTRINCFINARNLSRILAQTSQQMREQAITWIYSDNANIPIDYIKNNVNLKKEKVCQE